jgi:hypothetical protein
LPPFRTVCADAVPENANVAAAEMDAMRTTRRLERAPSERTTEYEEKPSAL